MVPQSALQSVRKLQITASRLATGLFAGEYRSAFKGKGIEFGEVREYQPGDDIRSIDWNVTARTGRPHVKRYREEREVTVMFLLDLSLSCRFGTGPHPKSRLAAELCALLAFAAVKNNDTVGLVLFTDRIEKFVPPGKGVRQAARIVREALSARPEGGGTDIPLALDYVTRALKRHTILFIVSDFYSPGFEKPLAIAAHQHDVIALVVTDPLELSMPDIGIARFRDAETGAVFWADTSDSGLRADYHRQARARFEERKKRLHSMKADSLHLASDAPYLPPLLKFFRMRARRLYR